MRWARERSLPVHRLPGGKQGSVFAYEHELKAWAGQLEQSDLAEDLPALPDDAPPSPASPAGEPIRLPPAVPEAPGKRTPPLFVALGAAEADPAQQVYHDKGLMGGVTASSYKFG